MKRFAEYLNALSLHKRASMAGFGGKSKLDHK
jgi:hypothetical protein